MVGRFNYYGDALPATTGSASGEKMNTKMKNVLTALILVAVAACIYIFAVIKAVSQ
ncbi:MAG: hypothetical protein ACXW09_09905 [Methylococcaceae bacterium]